MRLRVVFLAAVAVTAACGSSSRQAAGLRVPPTYEQACATGGGGVCNGPVSGPIPDALRRTPDFPTTTTGGTCPTSKGRSVTTPFSGSIVALGRGSVRILIDSPPEDLRHGVAVLGRTDEQGWLALKTHFFARPSYRGLFVVRVIRLDTSGLVELGGLPTDAPLVVPPGPTANMISGWREVPVSTWMRSLGCYAWSIDGLGFRDRVVVRARLSSSADHA